MRKLLILLALIISNSFAFAAEFQSFTLNNGQNVIIKEVKENPIVIIDTWIKTGSINENDKNNGVAHFLEHMFFKGTNKFSAGDFDKILESKGAITNAATSKDFTHYYITIPSKDFDTALEMHADMILNPLVPRVELEKERKVVLEEIAKNEDSPQRILYKNLISQIYKNHPYKREVIGTKNVIETITREEMLDFYNNFYTPQNMTTIIVGDVDTQATMEKINKIFNQPASKKTLPKYQKEKAISSTTEVIDRADVETAYLMIGFNGVDAKNKKENYELDVLATILGDGITSRLYKAIKDEKQLVQSISAYNSSSRDDGLFIISANFEPKNLEKVKKAIIDEIKLIQQTPPSQSELNKAFNIIERDTYYSRESISNISSEIGYIKTIFDDLNMYENYVQDIKKITPQQIQLATKKFLSTNKMAISIVVPKNYIAEKEIEPKSQEKIQAKLINEKHNTKKYILTNGVTIILNSNLSNDIIAMEVYAKGGKLIEEKAGTSSILSSAMLKGTKKYSKNEFANILEEKGLKIGASDGSENFTISVKTTKNELDIALDLLNEIVNNATLDTSTIDKIKTEKLYSIKASRDNPFYVALEEFKEMVFQNTCYKKTTTKQIEKSIPTITQDDIKNYYNNIFDAQNIVISINGNLPQQQQEKLFNFFNNTFKTKKTQTFNINNYKTTQPPAQQKQEKTTTKDTKAAWIVLGWKTCGIENEKDYVTLKVINSLLGSGMSSRLFTNLRDEQGLAYQIGSSYSANTNLGFFITYIGTNPNQTAHAKSEILKEIEILKHEFVTQEELQAAKDKLIGNFILSQETNSEKASTLGNFEVTNKGYDFINRYPDLIQNVTANDIIKVANKYFTNSYVYSLVTP